jgi:RNA polymerase sigma-70 factor (ECF subfamily)
MSGVLASTAEVLGGWRGLAAAGETEEAVAAESPERSLDYALAQRAAAGDREAFEEIYRLYHRRVYSVCLRMTCHVSEAEDLTQEVFIHLLRKLGGFRGESALGTWLHRLTVNQVLMHFRRNRARREQPRDDEHGEQPSAAGGDGHEGRPPVIDHIALSDALARLPEGYRTIFILHDVEGYEHEEVARLLGCAPGTSKSQLHKARKRLRELLGARSHKSLITRSRPPRT